MLTQSIAAKQSAARPKAAAISSSDSAADRKDLWTIIQEEMAAGGANGTGGAEATGKDDTTVVFAGAWRSGKSTLIQSFINKDKGMGNFRRLSILPFKSCAVTDVALLFFSFCCAEDVPLPTTGLDYQIARISTTISSADALAASASAAGSGGNNNGDGSSTAAAVEVQEVQSTFQLWEIGGGRTMVRMADICLTPESVQRAMAVVVVDLSKPARVVDDLQFWLGALKAQVRTLLCGKQCLCVE
jgi:hypothetical protein